MRNKVSHGEYLAFLSVKYEVDPDRFFYALISASENKKSTCGSLSIECRNKQKNKVILLITKGAKVVAQFPVPEEFLSKQGNPIREFKETVMLQRRLIKRDNRPRSFQIRDLRVGIKKLI